MRRNSQNAAHLNFLAGQLATLTGLGALRNLDLQLIGVGEVVSRHAKAAAGDLLDGAALGVARAVLVRQQPPRVLAALSCRHPPFLDQHLETKRHYELFRHDTSTLACLN